MNKIFLTLIISAQFSFSLTSFGQEKTILSPSADTLFLKIPADSYPLQAEGLPLYNTSIKVGKSLPGTQFKISLNYPEYEKLNSKETQWAQLHKDRITDKVVVESHLAFSRKMGYLDISFLPIIQRGKDFFRLVSCKIEITPQLSSKTAKSTILSTENGRWKGNSILKEGKWAKLHVKKEGVYTLTPAFLSKMGFYHPEKVKLYGYGGLIQEENWTFENEDRQVIDDLREIPLHRRENGDAIFFAEGTVRWTYSSSKGKWTHENNPYSSYSYYFITEGEHPDVMQKQSGETKASKTINTVPYYAVDDEDTFGWYHGGRELYDDYDFAYGPSHTFKVKAVSADTTKKKTEIDISFSASSTTSSTGVAISHNDKKLGNLNIPKFSSFQSGYEVRKTFTTNSLDVNNSFLFKVNPSNAARLNFIRVNYNRVLRATDAPFSFSPCTIGNIALEIDGATNDTRLWQIGNYNQATSEVKAELKGNKLLAQIEDGKQRFVIVNLSENYPTPEWDGIIENQDLHGDHNAYDMIILIPESNRLLEEAQRLAKAHSEMQGLRVKIVNAGQIFNEFSSGTPDATAYRRYLKMLYDRAENDKDLPRYLLLFGNCAWDNRMLTQDYSEHSAKDYLLSFEVSDGFSNPNNSTFPIGEQNSYVTDDYFGWLDDNEGNNYTRNKVDLSIGRFPCNDIATAKTFVDKSIAYLENKNTGAWKNTIYVLADDGNGNLHMNDAETVIQQIEKSTDNSAIIKKVYNDAYSRVATGTGHTFPTVTKTLKSAMNQGALIFNYTGHGSPDQLSHTKILETPDFEVPSMGNLPLWIMASCEISPYDSKRYNLGQAALENPNGGAIAVMCASRAVYSNYNRILNISFNKFLFSNDETGKRNTIGDALRLTKVDLVTPSDYGGIKDGSINKLKYVLLGNPAIPLSAPTGKVVVDSINGKALVDQEKIQLKAGSLAQFCGHIEDEKGEKLPNFIGSVTATLADRKETIVCKNNDGSADEPMVYEDRTKTIFEGSDSIQNGLFKICFRIPRDISYTNDCGRITFYAVNKEKDLECHGANEQIFLNGTDTSFAPDSLSPEVFVYLNHPDFPDGGITAPNPTFFARIKDDAGINATGIGIGHDMELVLDENSSAPIQLNNNFSYDFGSYREGLVSYPMQNLDFGKHVLSFRVWDVNGNSTTKKLKFHIQDDINKTFDVYATNNPCRTTTDFVTTFEANEEVHTATFEIYSLNGQRLWKSKDVMIPAGSGYAITSWNLKNNSGGKVPAGIYLYKVIVRSESKKQESKAKKIIVLEQ